MDQNALIKKPNNLKTGIKYLTMGIGCIIVIYILLMLFLVMMVGNQRTGPKEIAYSFSYYGKDTVIPPDTDILIPAIINEKGDPVFSEKELNELAHSDLQTPYRDAYNFSYVSTKYGPMILIRSLKTTELPDLQYVFVYLKTDNFSGTSFYLSSVVENKTSVFSKQYTIPVYVNETISGNSYASVILNFYVCGYDPEHPYDCKGYSSGPPPDQRSWDARGFFPVEMVEFGEFNDLRHGNPLVLPFEYFKRTTAGT